MIGTLVTTKAETSSYLDMVDGSEDVYSSNGWLTSTSNTYHPGDYLVDGDFFGGVCHNRLNDSDAYIRIDLKEQVMI